MFKIIFSWSSFCLRYGKITKRLLSPECKCWFEHLPALCFSAACVELWVARFLLCRALQTRKYPKIQEERGDITRKMLKFGGHERDSAKKMVALQLQNLCVVWRLGKNWIDHYRLDLFLLESCWPQENQFFFISFANVKKDLRRK